MTPILAVSNGSRNVSAASGGGIPQPSPLMDAPGSVPGYASSLMGGVAQLSTEGRIKIGQTALHNPGGG